MSKERETQPDAGAPPRRRGRVRVRNLWFALVLIGAVGALLTLPTITGLTQGVADSRLFLLLSTRSSSP